MNELSIFDNNADQTPIEVLLQVGEDGTVSSKNVYAFLELRPDNYSKWCRRNILENEFAEENVDFTQLVLRNDTPVGGVAITTEYKLTVPFAKKLCMIQRSERGEQARDYFIAVEDTLKRVAQNIPQLSTNELVLKIAQANVEYDKKLKAHDERLEAQDEHLALLEQTVQESHAKLDTAISIFAKPGNSWKDSMEMAIREIAGDGGRVPIKLKGNLYQELEIVANVDIQSRLTRKRNRMKKQGATRKEYMAINKLDIISYDDKLRPIFESIVRKYQAIYAAK